MPRPHNIPDREARAFSIELRAEDEDSGPLIRGYAAVFNQQSEPIMGLFREQLEPGAFKRALRGKPDVLALWNHDANHVLGRSTAKTLRMVEDDKGLAVEIEPPETTWASDLLASMKRGDVRQMSFAFTVQPKDERWEKAEDGTDIRTIVKVDRLYDVSVVSRPAYPQTTAAVRAAAGIDFDALYLVAERNGMGEGDAALIRAAMAALAGLLPPDEPPPHDWRLAAAHRARHLELLRLQVI